MLLSNQTLFETELCTAAVQKGTWGQKERKIVYILCNNTWSQCMQCMSDGIVLEFIRIVCVISTSAF